MSKLSTIMFGTFLALGWLSAPATAHILGPDATVCESGNSPAVLVRVHGFKTRSGMLRVQIYGSNPSDFLAKGKKLKRIDMPVTPGGAMDVCVALPEAGQYAVAVRHDIRGDGKSGWDDGGGFSRNPSISLFNLKPNFRHVVITVPAKVEPIDVVLNYRSGMSIGPIAMAAR